MTTAPKRITTASLIRKLQEDVVSAKRLLHDARKEREALAAEVHAWKRLYSMLSSVIE